MPELTLEQLNQQIIEIQQVQQKIQDDIQQLTKAKTDETFISKKEKFSNLVDDLNIIEVVSSVPTHIPVHPLKKIVLYISGATYRLYIYDSANQTWRYCSLT